MTTSSSLIRFVNDDEEKLLSSASVTSSSSSSSHEYGFRLGNVSVFYGKKQVLKNVSLECKRGDIFALLGPSGCGKTTSINTLVKRFFFFFFRHCLPGFACFLILFS